MKQLLDESSGSGMSGERQISSNNSNTPDGIDTKQVHLMNNDSADADKSSQRSNSHSQEEGSSGGDRDCLVTPAHVQSTAVSVPETEKAAFHPPNMSLGFG